MMRTLAGPFLKRIMKTYPIILLTLAVWLVMAAPGGIFQALAPVPYAGPDRLENPAMAILDATDPGLSRVAGRLLLGAQPVTGLLISRTDEAVTWTPYREGLRHGREISRYWDGGFKVDRLWIKGKRDGQTRAWWPDGTLMERSAYTDDLLQGESRRWFADGQLASAFTYEKGQEEGAQQMWYEDGTLRANYVVVDGRRYGSNGTKGCTSEVSNDD